MHDHADWVEVGTSLVKRYGMPGVAGVVAAAGGVPVLADLKTADDARTELTMAADAGARSVTVLGLAAPATLDVAASVAAAAPATAVLAAHVPKDVQTENTYSAALLGNWAVGRRLAQAGGLGVRDVPAVARRGMSGSSSARPSPLPPTPRPRPRSCAPPSTTLRSDRDHRP